MNNEACIIVGVPLDDVVKVSIEQASVTRYNERTGEPYTKMVRLLSVKIAGREIFGDEEGDVIDEYGSVETFVDQKVQEVIGAFGAVNVFREYGLLGIDFACLEQGREVSDGNLMLEVDVSKIISAMQAFDDTLKDAYDAAWGGTESKLYLCGSEGGEPFEWEDEEPEASTPF